MKVQNSEYAMADGAVYHAHVDCPDGRTWRTRAELRGPMASDGRTYCETCRLMDAPARLTPLPGELRAIRD